MLALRDLVIETAKDLEELDEIHETLKWGEPSFVTKIGSTLRMDWKAKRPDHCVLYFQCTSRLVDSFRLIFGDRLTFEGNRAILLPLEEDIPKSELVACIRASLCYHKVKKYVDLGIS